VASWILTPPGDLTDDDRAALAQITGRCEELQQTGALVREFADMLCNRRGERLEAWASQAHDSPVSELRGFAKGLRSDWAAVTAGLTVSYSSGKVEGTVNKMLKRQMYGRAKPDLLRKRVLLAD
jgi:transposase